jgi:hypothetical protein
VVVETGTTEASRKEPVRESEKPAPSSSPAATPAAPKPRHISYAVAGAESAAAAAAAAAHGASILALNPQVVIDPKIGTLEGLHLIENRRVVTSNTGGSSRQHVYQPPTQDEEIEQDAKAQQEENAQAGNAETKTKGKVGGGEAPKERLVHAERLAFEDNAEKQERGRGRGGRGKCGGCGTELPESQREACPVCAQSGPDVIAMTSIHYRFAGHKFLAAADSVAASSQARGAMEGGLVESVVSLRYKPKIPGHKDFLRFRAL